jgi:hypothetical protein
MAIEEAQLEDVGSGLAPVSGGWFVVIAADAAWVRNEAFGGRCVFESTPRVLAERPDVEPQFFIETGFTLAVLEHDRLPALGDRTRARRGRRDRDGQAGRGVRALPDLAARAPGRLGRPAVGLAGAALCAGGCAEAAAHR